jgi:hypothetical protein
LKPKTKSIIKAETALQVYQTETFSGLVSDIFTRPVRNSLAVAHIKKAVLNVGVVVELCATQREAALCLEIAQKLNDLAQELHDRPENQTSLDKEERKRRLK